MTQKSSNETYFFSVSLAQARNTQARYCLELQQTDCLLAFVLASGRVDPRSSRSPHPRPARADAPAVKNASSSSRMIGNSAYYYAPGTFTALLAPLLASWLFRVVERPLPSSNIHQHNRVDVVKLLTLLTFVGRCGGCPGSSGLVWKRDAATHQTLASTPAAVLVSPQHQPSGLSLTLYDNPLMVYKK